MFVRKSGVFVIDDDFIQSKPPIKFWWRSLISQEDLFDIIERLTPENLREVIAFVIRVDSIHHSFKQHQCLSLSLNDDIDAIEFIGSFTNDVIFERLILLGRMAYRKLCFCGTSKEFISSFAVDGRLTFEFDDLLTFVPNRLAWSEYALSLECRFLEYQKAKENLDHIVDQIMNNDPFFSGMNSHASIDDAVNFIEKLYAFLPNEETLENILHWLGNKAILEAEEWLKYEDPEILHRLIDHFHQKKGGGKIMKKLYILYSYRVLLACTPNINILPARFQ